MQLQSIAFSTTGYVRSTSSYHPQGVPIFPKPPEITEQTKSKTKSQHEKHLQRSSEERAKLTPSTLLRPSSSNQVSNAPKSGSGESESESLVLYVVVSSSSKWRCAECPSPVARKKRCSDKEFSGAVRKSGDCISPTVEERRVVRSTASSGQSCRGWSEGFRSSPHGHGSASRFRGSSDGERLQNTRQSARVSAQSMPCK